jgi:nucleotide sugar dehydrogenase
MSKPTIGVIGFGFVGQAIVHGFGLVADIRIYDINPVLCQNTLEDLCESSEFIFISVPTPMIEETGEADTSIVEETIQQCLDYIDRERTIFIIKSTIPPGTVDMLINRYNDEINIIHNPEFLTARNSKLDFINSSRIILGGNREITNRVEKLYRKRFIHTPILHVDSTTAEMIKYTSNCFFTTKLSFLNEIYQMCEKLGVDYNEMIKGVLLDQRIGNSHYEVPGHDKKLGWGGPCFSKDLPAFIYSAKELGVEPTVMKATLKKNKEVRK